jgi:hypothetical protein
MSCNGIRKRASILVVCSGRYNRLRLGVNNPRTCGVRQGCMGTVLGQMGTSRAAQPSMSSVVRGRLQQLVVRGALWSENARDAYEVTVRVHAASREASYRRLARSISSRWGSQCTERSIMA